MLISLLCLGRFEAWTYAARACWYCVFLDFDSCVGDFLGGIKVKYVASYGEVLELSTPLSISYIVESVQNTVL